MSVYTSLVATVASSRLLGCDGFRVESPLGLLGWVEETWLGERGEPAALALRLVDGRRALLLAEDVEAVVDESGELVVAADARVFALDAPHVERLLTNGGRPLVAASWTTTGDLLDPPQPPGVVRHALLALRPWRLTPPRAQSSELSVGKAAAILLPALGLLVALEIGLAFLVAYLVTGRAY